MGVLERWFTELGVGWVLQLDGVVHVHLLSTTPFIHGAGFGCSLKSRTPSTS
jgi:hypothetical protein